MKVYQNNCGQIQFLNFYTDDNTCTVNFKFSQDNLNTVGNHHDAITLISKSKKSKDKADGKRSVPTFKKPFIKTKVKEIKKQNSAEYVDLTDEDPQPQRLHDNSTDHNCTSSTDSWSDETYISSDGLQGNLPAEILNQGLQVVTLTVTVKMEQLKQVAMNIELYNMEELSTTAFLTMNNKHLQKLYHKEGHSPHGFLMTKHHKYHMIVMVFQTSRYMSRIINGIDQLMTNGTTKS